MKAFSPRARDHRGVPHRSARGRRMAMSAAGVIAAFLLPGLTTAHPLGNFTINHYAGLRVEPQRIVLDLVIDQAEIPAFQARLKFDLDGDGELSVPEAEAGRLAACRDLAPSLDLRIDGRPQSLELTEAGLAFPPGVGGLATMRSVCVFEAALTEPVQAGNEIAFADRSFNERIGWREIVVQGSGVEVASAVVDVPLRTSSPSKRLTDYPADLLTRALADDQVAFVVTPGGATQPPLDVPDADPVPGSGEVAIASPAAADLAASVPGGVSADEIPSIFLAADLTPFVLLVSIVTAAALGAGHALTPGHGKTLMAAYLVGTRGSPVHAAGLGLSVALSHTLGILALAVLVVGAQGALPPDVVARTTPVVAAISIVAIGGWMLYGEARRRWRARVVAGATEHHHDDPGHGHDYQHGHDHVPGPALGHSHGNDAGGHSHSHDPAMDEHSHGGRRHSHVPAPGSTITWRSLFVLGLAGGLIPSFNALLILLGAIAAGRPAFGFVLVVAFGLGMALVMGGIGLALVLARGRLDRVDASTRLGQVSAYLPLVASFMVLGFGIYLTIQAVSGNTVL